MNFAKIFIFSFFLQFELTYSNAATFVLPASGDVIGAVQYTAVEPGETLEDIEKYFDVGHYELLRANALSEKSVQFMLPPQLAVPLQFILPDAPRQGIVINLAEYRLYYFPKNENVVHTFPIGIGRKGWKTPLGKTKIASKEINPKWHPTQKMHHQAQKLGRMLPEEFPASPYNPLGKYAMRLGWATFLIHSSNNIHAGIGTRASAGCIRMFPEDMDYLFHLVPVETPVRVINQPVKIGKKEGVLMLQIHPLLSDHSNESLPSIFETQLTRWNINNFGANKIIQNELKVPSGLVIKIS